MITFKMRGAWAMGGVALLATAGSLVFTPASASAEKPGERLGGRQRDPTVEIIPYIEFDRLDMREALRQLFGCVGVAYTLAPDVKRMEGRVTVSLRNLTWAAALDIVLRQLDLTYGVTGGVFYIIKREHPPGFARPAPPPALAEPPSAPSGITSDGPYLYIVQSRRLYKVRKSDLRVVARGDLQRRTLERLDVRMALRELARSTGTTFKIPPDLRGKVTVEVGGYRSFPGALEEILRQVGARYEIGGGVYHIIAEPSRRR